MYRLLVTPAFEWDVGIVKECDILKDLYNKLFNYYYVISKVNIARLNNYYYVINGTCNHSQIETELVKVPLSQLLF